MDKHMYTRTIFDLGWARYITAIYFKRSQQISDIYCARLIRVHIAACMVSISGHVAISNVYCARSKCACV